MLDALLASPSGTINVTLVPTSSVVALPYSFERKLGGGGHVVLHHGTHVYRIVLEVTDQGIEAHAVISAPRAPDAVDLATQVLAHFGNDT